MPIIRDGKQLVAGSRDGKALKYVYVGDKLAWQAGGAPAEPSIVGATNGSGTTVTLPEGIEAGDLILIAVTAMSSAVSASGYASLGNPWLWREAVGNETTATKTGSAGWVAVVIRGVVTDPDEWHTSTTLGNLMSAPSISEDGDLLICAVSSQGLSGTHGPLNVPSGMTLVGRTPAAQSTAAVAALFDPPNPTGTRTFTNGDMFAGTAELSLLLPAA